MTDYALWAAPCAGFDGVGIEVWELTHTYENLFYKYFYYYFKFTFNNSD